MAFPRCLRRFALPRVRAAAQGIGVLQRSLRRRPSDLSERVFLLARTRTFLNKHVNSFPSFAILLAFIDNISVAFLIKRIVDCREKLLDLPPQRLVTPFACPPP